MLLLCDSRTTAMCLILLYTRPKKVTFFIRTTFTAAVHCMPPAPYAAQAPLWQDHPY